MDVIICVDFSSFYGTLVDRFHVSHAFILYTRTKKERKNTPAKRLSYIFTNIVLKYSGTILVVY